MNKKAFLLACLVALLIILILLSYNYNGTVSPAKGIESVVWEKVYSRRGSETGEYVQQTSDGGYIVVGQTIGKGWDIWLVKTDAEGNRLWSKNLGGDFADYGYCVQQTTDGGYIVAGSTMVGTSWEDVFARGGDQLWLVKTDAKGNKVWDKVFGEGDIGRFVQQTSDGGYIVVGEMSSGGEGGLDVWLVKINPDGTELWNKKFEGEDHDTAYCVQQTSDKGYIIVGETYSYGAGSSDMWLIKTDPDGNKLWDKTFGGRSKDIGRFVQQTSDGGYVVTGETGSYTAGFSDVWVIKTDSEGNELWSQTSGGKYFDRGYCVRQTIDSGYIVIGSLGGDKEHYVNEIYRTDVVLVKLDPSGNELWQLSFGKSSIEWGTSVIQTTDGSYVITGFTGKELSGLARLNCANFDRTFDERLFLIKLRYDE